MGVDEWIDSLRKRYHAMANLVTEHDGKLIRLEEKGETINKRLEDLEELEEIVRSLQHQSFVLKWVVGLISTLAVGILIKLI